LATDVNIAVGASGLSLQKTAAAYDGSGSMLSKKDFPAVFEQH
jgi:hypothetical protein